MVDVIRDEADRSIAKNELNATSVGRAVTIVQASKCLIRRVDIESEVIDWKSDSGYVVCPTAACPKAWPGVPHSSRPDTRSGISFATARRVLEIRVFAYSNRITGSIGDRSHLGTLEFFIPDGGDTAVL